MVADKEAWETLRMAIREGMKSDMLGCAALRMAIQIGYLQELRVFDSTSRHSRIIVTFPPLRNNPVLKFNLCPFCGTPFTKGSSDQNGIPQCSDIPAPRIRAPIREFEDVI